MQCVRVLNSAPQIVSNTRKFDRGLAHFQRTVLHRLDVVDRVRFSLRSCVEMSAQHGFLIPVHSLPTRLQRSWLPTPATYRLTAVTWTSLVSDRLHTADVHLLTTVHQTGTHFLTTSETIIFLCQLLNVKTFLFCSALGIFLSSMERHALPSHASAEACLRLAQCATQVMGLV